MLISASVDVEMSVPVWVFSLLAAVRGRTGRDHRGWTRFELRVSGSRQVCCDRCAVFDLDTVPASRMG